MAGTCQFWVRSLFHTTRCCQSHSVPGAPFPFKVHHSLSRPRPRPTWRRQPTTHLRRGEDHQRRPPTACCRWRWACPDPCCARANLWPPVSLLPCRPWQLRFPLHFLFYPTLQSENMPRGDGREDQWEGHTHRCGSGTKKNANGTKKKTTHKTKPKTILCLKF